MAKRDTKAKKPDQLAQILRELKALRREVEELKRSAGLLASCVRQ